MKRAVPLALLVLASCSERKLWIAPKGDELHLQLVDHEPPPF